MSGTQSGNLAPVAGRFGSLTLRADELAGYRAAVIICAEDEDRDACERLLGQLATLEAQAREGDELSFTAPPGAQDLANRAFTHLRLEPLQSRRASSSAR